MNITRIELVSLDEICLYEGHLIKIGDEYFKIMSPNSNKGHLCEFTDGTKSTFVRLEKYEENLLSGL